MRYDAVMETLIFAQPASTGLAIAISSDMVVPDPPNALEILDATNIRSARDDIESDRPDRS